MPVLKKVKRLLYQNRILVRRSKKQDCLRGETPRLQRVLKVELMDLDFRQLEIRSHCRFSNE